jgi:hypothetical protein
MQISKSDRIGQYPGGGANDVLLICRSACITFLNNEHRAVNIIT